MKNMKRYLSLALVLCMALALFAGCNKIEVPTNPPATNPNVQNPTNNENQNPTTTPPVDVELLPFEVGTVLRMACGYNNKKTGLFFDAEVAKDGITLADGKTYNAGDLKPTWVEVQNRLGMVFEDKYQGNSATNELKFWAEKFNEVDMVAGNATGLNEYGAAGQLVNIAEYLDLMPNFKAYLEANPIVRVSITGTDENGELGAIYFSPYFDGVSAPVPGSYVKVTATFTQTVDLGDYVDFDCFTMMATACETLGEAKGPNGGKLMFITASSLNVRTSSDTSTSDNILGQLSHGDMVEVFEQDAKGWYRIEFNGQTAYISNKYVSETKP